MDLITCENCNNKISRSDLICPYCGHRNKEKVQWWKNSQVYKITGLVLMGIGVFAGIVKGLILGVSVFVVGAILFLTSKFLPQW